MFKKVVDSIHEGALISTGVLILILVIVDLYITVRYLFKLNNTLEEIQIAFNHYKGQSLKRTKEFKNTIVEKFEKSGRFSDKIEKLQFKRIARAFPKLRPQKANDAWQKLKTRLLSKNKNGNEEL